MAGYIGEADILVGADASGFEKGLHSAVSAASKFARSSLGAAFADVGQQMEAVGGKLTRGITVPALGAAVAAAGITAALGWKRLVSIDTAQGQLRGLGYSGEDVTRISEQLADALEGGMLTMGEATSAAAAGMAAGVSEGKELTRYIQLLDAAVVGGTGSFEEMNQIFARVMSQGKLTRGEFDMIEQRMPGFASAVQDAMGVSTDEMYEMLSAGEITSDQFLDVMENFAGDMATEYAKTWEGMVQNTWAYVGILGQALLGGVFEQSKESIAQLLDLLSSEEAAAWAASMGEAIGEAFTNIVNFVTSAVQAFMDLPGPIQKFAGALGLALVSAGPLVFAMGRLIGIGFQAVAAFQVAGSALAGWRLAASGANLTTKMLTGATSAQTVAAHVGAAANGIWATSVRMVRGAMVGLWTSMKANPLGWILGAIAAVTAGLVYFFTQTETGRDLWAQFTEAMAPVIDRLKEIGSAIAEAAGDLLTKLGPALSDMMGTLGEVFSGLMPIIGGAFEAVMPLVESYLNIMGGLFEALAPMILPLLEEIAVAFGGLMEALAPLVPMFADAGMQIVSAFAPVVEQIVGELVPVFMELVATVLPMLMGAFTQFIPLIGQVVTAIAPLIASLVESLAPVIADLVAGVFPLLMSVLSAIIPLVMSLVQAILPLVVTLVEMLAPIITELVTTLLPILMQVFMAIIPVILQVVAALIPLVTTIITILVPAIQAILDIVVAVFTALAPIISAALNIVIGVINTIIGVLTGDWSRAWDGIKQILQGVWDLIKSIVTGAINVVSTIISSTLSVISGFWSGIWNGILSVLSSIWSGIQNAVSSAISSVQSVISSVLSAISSLWSSIWNGVSSAFSSIWSSIVSAAQGFMSSVQSTFQSVLSFIGSIPSSIMGYFSGMGSMLVSSGRALIDGFKNGIMNAFNGVKNAVSNGISSVRNLFPFSPAKEGPFSGRGWVEYAGESVGDTFAASIADSLRSGTADVSRALKPMSMEFNRPDFARTVMPLAEPQRVPARPISEEDGTVQRPIQVNGPLVNIEGGLTVDSDDRVRQLSQELWNRANRTDRAQGRVNLGGVVRQ